MEENHGEVGVGSERTRETVPESSGPVQWEGSPRAKATEQERGW